MKYDLLIYEFAIRTGTDPALIKAIMKRESNFKNYLKGPESKGRYSYGLMQILDQTAREVFGVYNYNSLFDPRTNLFYSTKLLKDLKRRYPNNIKHQIAGYNAGSAKFNVLGNYINQKYVDYVYKWYKIYKARLFTGISLIAISIFGVLLLKED